MTIRHHLQGWKINCVGLLHPSPQRGPGRAAGFGSRGAGAACPSRRWPQPRLGGSLAPPAHSSCALRQGRWEPLPMAWQALRQDHGAPDDPGPSPCPPAALCFPIPPPPSPFLPLPSLFFSFSPHLLLSFPPLFSFLLLLPSPLSSYLIPLVFLLSACPADLHARCVEAAQLDLMPPAARSRSISGLSAALLRAGPGSCSVHPTTLDHALAPFCIAFCSSSPFSFPSYTLFPVLLPLLLSSPSLLPGPHPCACAAQISSLPLGWFQVDGPKPCSQLKSSGLVCRNWCCSHGLDASVDLET